MCDKNVKTLTWIEFRFLGYSAFVHLFVMYLSMAENRALDFWLDLHVFRLYSTMLVALFTNTLFILLYVGCYFSSFFSIFFVLETFFCIFYVFFLISFGFALVDFFTENFFLLFLFHLLFLSIFVLCLVYSTPAENDDVMCLHDEYKFKICFHPFRNPNALNN